LSETPSRLGVISLGKLKAGTHWFLVNLSTVLRIELPVAEEIIEPSLPQYPNLIGKNLDVKVAVEGEDNVEVIAIQIHNRTAETIELTEANFQLMTAIKGPCADARIMSPLWSKAADGEALPETTIAPDQTATLRLNWADWVKHGFWFSRDGEVLAEPSFPELEAGRTWVRVTLGSARPVSVTHPDKIVARGDDNRGKPASGESEFPRSQDVTPAPKSVPDPRIDNPSDEPTSEQDDLRDLVVVDSSDYGDTEFMMRMVELERNAKTSKLRLTYKKRSSAVGSSMFMMWGLYEVAKARGTEYFICLDGSSDRQNETVFIAGFTNTKDADIQEIFGKLYSHAEIDGQKRKYWSVSEWEFFSRSVSWGPPNDDSEAKAEIAAIRLAVEQQGTPSEKHAVLTGAFAKSDSPHVKMRILQIAKVVKAPEFEPFLLSVLQDKTDVRDRILAVMALAEYGSAASIEPLLDCAEHDPEGEAGAGCMRCRTTARPDAYLALAEIGLRHPAERDRIAAAVAAIRVTTNDISDPKAQALYILTQDQKLLKPFLDRLQDEDPETRKLGVRALRPFKLSYAPEQLVKLLADSNPDVQADAARLLGMIGDPKTIPVLIEAATATDGDRRVRCNSIGSLGDMRATQAEPTLRDLLADESVQVVAAIALSRITGERHPLVPEGYNLD
jgi:HEAT repeat protein